MPPIFKTVLFGLLYSFCSFSSHGQLKGLTITGTIVDSIDGLPIPYATIVANSSITKDFIIGTTSAGDGSFVLHSDSAALVLEITYIGYTKKTISKMAIVNGKVSLGQINLEQSSQMLEEMSITAERSSVEFRLDKRVFNVGKDIASTGMGAMEVLNSVPSVHVDIEGQISLRGNSGVQVLIDGKPSARSEDQSNLLANITADMIERIEVITNPSANQEAAGTSGIINVILKKEEKKGFNGSVSLNSGVPNNHSLGASLNYRTDKFNFFTQFGAGYRSRPGYSKTSNINVLNGLEVSSEAQSVKNEEFYNATVGADYYINDFNILTLSGKYAYEIETQPSGADIFIYDSLGQLISQYERIETAAATNPKWQYDLQYEKQFKNNKEHVLLISGLGSFFGKDKTSEYLNEHFIGDASVFNQRSAADFYEADYVFKLDYINPISSTFTLETGGLYEINDVGNDYSILDLRDGQWVVNEDLTNDFRYNQKVLGLYGTAAYEGEKWGIKLGLRMENTHLITLLVNSDEENTQNYTNLFPSLHTSYALSPRVSFQAGYSRRILRPSLWELNPFYNIQNNYNIRTGNPELMPEYANSYEATAIFSLNNASVNTSLYHLYTTDVTESISYFDGEVNITKPANVGTNAKTGFELNGKYTLTDWMTFNGDFNYGYFNRKGAFENQNFDFTGDQWSLRLTTKFSLPGRIDLEISPRYQSGYKTVQGEVLGYAFADAGLRKKLWDGKANFNLGVRDIFASRVREVVVNQPGFSVYSFSQRGRFITLGFSYGFGKGEAMTYYGGKR